MPERIIFRTVISFQYNPVNIKAKQHIIWWVLFGVAGLIIFFALRGSIDFHAGASIEMSRDSALEHNIQLLQRLGMETDTIAAIPFRQQNYGIYMSLRDSLEDELPKLQQLNESGFHLNGWDIVTSGQLSMNESFSLTAGGIYNSSGIYRIQIDNGGKVKKFLPNTEEDAQPFLAGNSTREIAERVVGDVFEYDLNQFSHASIDTSDSGTMNSFIPADQQSAERVVPEGGETTFTWREIVGPGEYQTIIELDLQPSVRQIQSDTLYQEVPGAEITRFEAYHELEEIAPASLPDHYIAFFIFGIALITLLVFIEGLYQLFKGKADWKRTLILAVLVALGIFVWRLLFLFNFLEIVSLQISLVLMFNQLVFGVVMGIFAALAYIGWEAYARTEKRFQMNLVDAFWRRKLYLRETGNAIIKGFSLGGIMLGVLAVTLFSLGLFLIQSDSQFGFTEPMNKPLWLSLNLSVLTNSVLVSVAVIGIMHNVSSKWIRNQFLAVTVSVLAGGLIFAGIGRTFATNGAMVEEFIVFIALAIPVFVVYHVAGILSVFAGWWFYSSMIAILPYMGSTSIEVVMISWLQFSIALVIGVFGFIAYRYAPPLSTVDRYVPEYERRMLRSLRIENEMQIARESQSQLLPLKAPDIKGVDLFGYFIPSSEVGGDYFDYITGTNSEDKQVLKLTVIDVSGKSMKAAMQAVFTSGLLRSRMNTDEPAIILREISPVIHEKTDNKTFITCLVVSYEPVSKQLVLANAGHCYPILKRNGKAEYIQTPEPRYPLGMKESVPYKELSIQLQKDDLVLFYSDGFPEAVDPNGNHLGFDEALSVIEEMETDGRTSVQICSRLKEFLKEFSHNTYADDTTIVCLKIG